jgi:5-methylthioadenosine/S-adenosylhomocysteine deaminase
MTEHATADLLIRNGLLLTMDGDRTVHRGGDLAIKGGRIMALGPQLDIQTLETIDASHHVVLPGLINGHMHETLTRGIAEDLRLDRWLDEICFPIDSALTPNIMRGSAMMSQLEMIRGGITTFLDIYRHPEACANVVVQSGLRGVLAPQIILDPLGPGETLETAEAFVSAWLDRHPRVSPMFGPHAPYSVPPEGYTRVAALAEEYGVGIHTHLSETEWEVQTIAERYGARSPAAHLDGLGLLDTDLSVAHGVFLDSRDIELLAGHGVPVMYNPSSNMKLASGIAPIPALRAAGVKVGIATDSNLSNNNLDMFEEMRLGAMLQKLHHKDPAALPVADLMAMATIEAAQALDLEAEIGSLEVGKQADLILLDLNQPHLWPLLTGAYENIAEQLVYSAGAADVTHTIVAGQVLMADRQVFTLDLTETREAVEEAVTELLSLAGLNNTAVFVFNPLIEGP